jgi:hypothetical protein
VIGVGLTEYLWQEKTNSTELSSEPVN